ncbi:glutamate--tRNA ligase [Caulobacter sp. NIBR2454]|uniref:glutamate--tRNA ligase n=1 Tax=Caulobacter sp. NIBR2454 TaxID=3015996 RepID=UPI0022B6BF51|nr:glutamate--tRNA ligase [Caulobacter sp. NIBR2454]
MSSPVVTRFAPSPTGYLHIGGARTALFNWLYARHTGGKFLLRVEDTDRERSTEAAVRAIFQGLDWMGLQSDEPPVFQFSRVERHKEAVQQLLDAGRAYRCWLLGDELEVEREKAKAAGHALRSPWRDRTDGDLSLPHVIRFRGAIDGETHIADLVQGDVTFQNKALDDLVLLRSDGAPTYNLAVVVDDHDMGVTHIIRGDDHLNNAARQALIYQALEWPLPTFAHIPLIHGPDGAKLSKRHGAQAVGDFEEMGYLPEAMRNYLARLGWSHGDDEIFSDEQAIGWFDIADVNKGAARLDWDKLGFVNAHYIRAADDNRLADLVFQVLAKRGEAADKEKLLAALPFVKERAKTILELADQCAFALKTRPIVLDDKTKGLLLADETASRLARLQETLSGINDWRFEILEPALKAFAESEGVGLGKIGPALRGVLTGGAPAPDLAKILAALGRTESLVRLNDALSQSR